MIVNRKHKLCRKVNECYRCLSNIIQIGGNKIKESLFIISVREVDIEREREREKDRQTEREIETETQRHRDRETERQRNFIT